jgi:hypothetical protein
MPIKQSIPSTTTTTTIACKNDFFELITESLSNPQNSTQLVVDNISTIIDKGLVKTNCGSCCPACGDFYVFSGFETYLKFAEAMFNYGIELDCCTNTAQYIDGNENFIVTNNCNNNFTTCIQNLQTQLNLGPGIGGLIPDGQSINEYSKLTGSGSILCGLIALLQTSPLYSPNLLYDVIKVLLDKGIVIYCNESTTVVASVETFLKYYEYIVS